MLPWWAAGVVIFLNFSRGFEHNRAPPLSGGKPTSQLSILHIVFLSGAIGEHMALLTRFGCPGLSIYRHRSLSPIIRKLSHHTLSRLGVPR